MKNLTQIFQENDLLFNNMKHFNRNSNFYVFLCYNLLFDKETILKNIGSYIIIVIFLLFIITLLLFIKYGYDDLEKTIHQIVVAKFFYLETRNKNKNYDFGNSFRRFGASSIIFTKDPMLQKDLFGNGMKSPKLKEFDKIKDILLPIDLENNWLSYDDTIKTDKRTFFQYYFSLIYRKNLVLFSFFPNIDYNSKIIKIYLFFFNFAVFLLINTFFFNDNLIHEIYIGNRISLIKIISLKTFYSFLISYIVIFCVKFLALTEFDIIQIKILNKKEQLGKFYAKVLKKIYKRYLIFAIINICFLIISWYYISSFCAVYMNTQIYLIINTIISFIKALLFPFIFCFIPSLLRFISLWDPAKDRERLYKVSRIVQII
jgi:hypothetical protein